MGTSRLRVYDWPAADGLRGGSPHLHTACAEGYVVLRGEGSVQTLGSEGFAEHPLHPGTLLWFTPGTVHRLVNASGDLEILVLMQNAGLPEAGDAVLTFPADVLADPGAYARAATAHDEASARARRDLALEGYAALRERVGREGPAALADLHAAAAALVRPRVPGFRDVWSAGPAAQAARTGEQLRALAEGRAGHLAEAAVRSTAPAPGERFGMCGRLTVWDVTAHGC
ncbi:cupin domain-containing protein [Kineococcus sp. SYSU DK002]|uniref:cupin domain-containing protein n=1 Tax=Kineococcus sp. SYSU DK002 TaxID=3383123 RepID=UPI003D7DF5BD